MVAHMHACARPPARMVHGWMDGYLCLSLSLSLSLPLCLPACLYVCRSKARSPQLLGSPGVFVPMAKL